MFPRECHCLPPADSNHHVNRPTMTADLLQTCAKPEGGEEVCIKNHPIYHFDDGSLVLDVQVQRFKLHHTLLSRHSRYFSSLISQSNPKGSGRDMHRDGYYHVVSEKLGVKSRDVEALLQHFYHDKPLQDNPDFDHVSSLLRVTSPQQLDFPQLHTSALRIFESIFPQDPSSFANRHPLHEALALTKQFKSNLVRKAVLYSLVTTTEFDTTGGEACSDDPEVATTSIVNAAQVNSSHNDQSPTNAISATAGSKVSIRQIENETINDTSIPASNRVDVPLQLSKEDAATCMGLMMKIVEHFTPILFTPAATPHMECTDVFADTWMTYVIQPAIEDDGVYKPLETLERMKSIDWAAHGLCPSCVEEKKEEWTEEQRTIWMLMDKWLGIDDL